MPRQGPAEGHGAPALVATEPNAAAEALVAAAGDGLDSPEPSSAVHTLPSPELEATRAP
jgi:hypothetical protein